MPQHVRMYRKFKFSFPPGPLNQFINRRACHWSTPFTQEDKGTIGVFRGVTDWNRPPREWPISDLHVALIRILLPGLPQILISKYPRFQLPVEFFRSLIKLLLSFFQFRMEICPGRQTTPGSPCFVILDSVYVNAKQLSGF